MSLKDHERAVLSAVMFEAGVVPIDNTNHDMRRGLKELPPDDARALKRKFRKVWRKLAKEEARKMGKPAAQAQSWLTNRYGAGKSNPSRSDKEARKRIVQKHFYENFVRPILDKFESGRTEDPQEPTKT